MKTATTMLQRAWLAPVLLTLGLLTSGFVMAPAWVAGAEEPAPADTVKSKKKIVIEIDPDGRVVVDGEALEEDADGTIVLHLDRGGDRVVVVPDGRRDRMRFFRSKAPGVHTFRFRDPQWPDDLDDLRDFDVDVFTRHERSDTPHVFFREGAPFGDLDVFRPESAEVLKERVEVMRMEQEARRLAREARQAEGAERQRLEAELRDHLDAIFEQKMDLRRKRVERLEAELQAQREKLDARRAARQEMIERRMRELMGASDELEW